MHGIDSKLIKSLKILFPKPKLWKWLIYSFKDHLFLIVFWLFRIFFICSSSENIPESTLSAGWLGLVGLVGVILSFWEILIIFGGVLFAVKFGEKFFISPTLVDGFPLSSVFEWSAGAEFLGVFFPELG